MLNNFRSAFTGHGNTPDEPQMVYKCVIPTLYGHKDDFHRGYSRWPWRLNLHPFERQLLSLVLSNLFTPTALGKLLRRLIIQWIISKLRVILYFILRLHIIIFHGLLHHIDLCLTTHSLAPHQYVPIKYESTSQNPPTAIPLAPSASNFDFSIRLISDDTRELPKALNSHLTRADFDPDFVATLLSRTNTSDDIVDIILDTGCTF